jgi:ANTAR domain
VSEDAQQRAIDTLRTGSADEAATAVGRLLAVTEAAYERRAQLEQALQSRVAIEQAKGILAERYGLELDQAFDLIRRAARSNRMKLQDLVRKIKPGKPTPEELASELAGLARRQGS